MNDRVMQFRLGMFVIVAGLVLTMMIVWFGEAPALLRNQTYLKVRYSEAPGVREGVPVRKSGIHVGEVFAVSFDTRPGQPDGVIVTLALERRYKIHKGAVPRITRSLIGDVSIDMQPGNQEGFLETGSSPDKAPIVDGEVAPDPSRALAAATRAFEDAGDTLKSINDAANGLAKIAKSSDKLDDFLTSVADAGRNVSKAAQGIERVIKTNETNLQPAITDLRTVANKLNDALDPKTVESFKVGLDRFSSAAARLDSGIAELDPLLKELGAPANRPAATSFGQAVQRINGVAADLRLLTSKLRNADGRLNGEGTIQKLITETELHDNLNRMAVSANEAVDELRAVLTSFRGFAEKVSQDPGVIGRGALQSR